MPYSAARVRHNRRTLSGFKPEDVAVQLTSRTGSKQNHKAVTLDKFLLKLEYPSQRVAVLDAVQKFVPIPKRRAK